MKTTSLSVASKKHICNQINPLKSEDTSAFDPTELTGAKEGSSPSSETTSMLFREKVDNWQDDHTLNLINKPEDQITFYSRRWCTTSTPYNVYNRDDK